MGRNKKNSSRRNKRGGQGIVEGSMAQSSVVQPTPFSQEEPSQEVGFIGNAKKAAGNYIGEAEGAASGFLSSAKTMGSNALGSIPGMGANNTEAPATMDPPPAGEAPAKPWYQVWGGRRRKSRKSRKMRGGNVMAAPQGFQSYGHVGGQSASRAMTTLGYASVKGGRRRRKSKKGTKKSSKRRRSRRA